MKESTSFLLRRQILQLGLYRLGKVLSGNTNTVSILCYHSFAPEGNIYNVPYEEFQRQIEAIREVADIIPLSEALEAMTIGRRRRKSAVAITIDDGYEDVMQLAEYSVREKIPITLFALSDPEHAERKSMDNSEKLVQFSDLRYLASKGWTIGCHGATHANLAKVSLGQLREEVVVAKQTLEKKVGVAIEYFAYPNGHFSNQVIQAVKEAGYEAACSILPGVLTPETNSWILPRTVVNTVDRITEDPKLYIAGPILVGGIIDKIGPWQR